MKKSNGAWKHTWNLSSLNWIKVPEKLAGFLEFLLIIQVSQAVFQTEQHLLICLVLLVLTPLPALAGSSLDPKLFASPDGHRNIPCFTINN